MMSEGHTVPAPPCPVNVRESHPWDRTPEHNRNLLSHPHDQQQSDTHELGGHIIVYLK